MTFRLAFLSYRVFKIILQPIILTSKMIMASKALELLLSTTLTHILCHWSSFTSLIFTLWAGGMLLSSSDILYWRIISCESKLKKTPKVNYCDLFKSFPASKNADFMEWMTFIAVVGQNLFVCLSNHINLGIVV